MSAEDSKGGFFGGLPTDLFDRVRQFLEQQAAGPAGAAAGTAAAGVLALSALAKEEHAGANAVDRPVVEVVFTLIEIQKAFEILLAAPAAALPGALAAFTVKLNNLETYWKGD